MASPSAEERLIRDVPTAPRQQGNAQEPPRAVRQLVAAAIAADRFDLFLQRVVGLPQRRLKGYDVTLRPDGSDLAIPNAEIRLAVEAVGHQLAFDRKLMIQAVRLARVFSQRERDVLLFVDISQRFLMSEAAFDDLEALIADVPQAPERIVLCLPQRFFRKAVAFEHEALRNLTKMGFHFMMRDIEDLDFDPGKLSQIGVRWLRMPAEALLAETQERETMFDVATADFVPLLARRKLAFMVDSVTDEPTIADLIDLNIEFAQGHAFSPPQAVRADVLEGNAAAPEPPRPTEPPAERRSLRDLARRA
jgi:cyclic-di-GMP phosphodiesterase TipF (flagellum assembly factor)